MPGPYDKLEKKAESLENQSKLEFNKKNYASVIYLLEEAKSIYAQLGFHGKIGMINQRIIRVRNLINFEEQGASVRKKREQDFQNRVQEVLSEKQVYREKQLAQQRKLSPEIEKILEKVKMLIVKSEREEKLGKYPRVIGRYKYILELYKSIPQDSIDLSNEISEIEKKLSFIISKM